MVGTRGGFDLIRAGYNVFFKDANGEFAAFAEYSLNSGSNHEHEFASGDQGYG